MTDTRSAVAPDAPPPVPDTETLMIHQERKVGWFDVRQLCATAAKALASTIVGSMAGRREVLAALDPRKPAALLYEHDYAHTDDIWIDYVADTGDGWDASYSVAYLVGRDAIYLNNDGTPTPQPVAVSGTAEPAPLSGFGITALPAGSILILGGDQVYPTASAAAYQGRLQDPYQCARPYDGELSVRDIYAIPGNHDWYDGLTSFIRLFCQRSPRSIGTWRTQQRRSYFAIRLREGWWLWAADLALEDDMDPPQRDYFTDQAGLLQKGDRVILCLPAPTWSEDAVSQDQDKRRQTKKTELLESQIRDYGARVVLTLAGDLHHYARHETDNADDVAQYITCGGGGAFTLGTSRQPQSTDLPDGRRVHLRKTFPSDEESRAMRWWSLLFPLVSAGFTALLVAYHLVLLYFVHAASRVTHLLYPAEPISLLVHLSETELSLRALYDLTVYLARTIGSSGIPLIMTLGLLGGCVLFARSAKAPNSKTIVWFATGLLHGLLQLLCAALCFWIAVRMILLGFPFGGPVFTLSSVLLAIMLMFAVNGFLFGAYLLASNIACGMHEQEVFSCQAIEDYKCFLRIKIEQDRATVYPIGLRRPGENWTPAPGVKLETSSYTKSLALEAILTVPAHTKRIYDPGQMLSPQLIEAPIVLR